MNSGTGRFLNALTSGLLMLALTACASTSSQEPPQQDDNRSQASERMAVQLRDIQAESRTPQAQPSLPAELDDLLLDRELPSRDSTRFDVSATDVPLSQFLDDLSEVANTNILLDGGVSGTVSLRLRDVTANDVMMALQDQMGIAFERADYGFRVSGDQLQTQMFRVNYLDIQRSGQSSTGVASGQIGGGDGQASQINTQNTTDFWGTLENTLALMMQSGGDRQLVVNPQTGLIVVKASPRELRDISDFLVEAELALQQQVIIEARIIEVNLSETFQSGIDWSILGSEGDLEIGAGVGAVQPSGSELDGMFNLSLDLGNFSSVIRALRTQGEVEVLSSPRISTVNNQKAVIKVGSEEQFVTVTSVSSTDDDGNPTVTPSFALEPYFSGIALDVTPQIADSEDIILHVHPSVIQVQATTKSFVVQGETYDLPLASSTIRETDSVIRAGNGQVVVIGGLLQNELTSLRSGLPGNGDGFFRRLFGQERTTAERTELIILLRPVIADADGFSQDIENTATRLLEP